MVKLPSIRRHRRKELYVSSGVSSFVATIRTAWYLSCRYSLSASSPHRRPASSVPGAGSYSSTDCCRCRCKSDSNVVAHRSESFDTALGRPRHFVAVTIVRSRVRSSPKQLFTNYLYDLSGPFVINTTGESNAACLALEQRLMLEGKAPEPALGAGLKCMTREGKPQEQIIGATREQAIRQLSKYPPGAMYFISAARSHRSLVTTLSTQFDARFLVVARSLLGAIYPILAVPPR